MRVLLTGATGFIGREVAVELFRAGHDVVVLARNPNRVREILPLPIKAFFWDAHQGPPSDEALHGIEAVIHLAGEPVFGSRWNESVKRTIYESRVLSTRQLCMALRKNAEKTLKVYFGASAIGFYGDRGDEVVTEDSPMGRGFLAEVCDSWEREAGKNLPRSVRQAFGRIGLVLGKGGGALDKMLPAFRLGLGGPMGDGLQWMSWIHLNDVVRMILWIVSSGDLSGPFNFVSPAPLRNGEFVGALGRALKRPAPMRVPGAALRLVLGEASEVLLGGQRVEPKKALAHDFQFRYRDISGALDDICAPAGKLGAFQKKFVHFVPKAPEVLFPFFSDEKNLERITPPWLNFSVLRKSTPEVGAGTLIDYTLKIKGVPAKWRTEIRDWHPPKRFVDDQIKGPYQIWHHVHEFEPLAGGTLMTDSITYKLPLGELGSLVAGHMVARDVDAIFAYRRRQIDHLFAGKEPAGRTNG